MESRWVALLMLAGFAVGLGFFVKYLRRFWRAYQLDETTATEQQKQEAQQESWSSSRGMVATAFCVLAYIFILGKYLTTTWE